MQNISDTKPLVSMRRIGGYAPSTLAVMAAVLTLSLWGTWATDQLLDLGHRKIVTVRLARVMGEFVEAEARGGADPQETKARVAQYLAAVQASVDALGRGGTTVLVAEAVVAGGAPDMTDAVRADVTRRMGGKPHAAR